MPYYRVLSTFCQRGAIRGTHGKTTRQGNKGKIRRAMLEVWDEKKRAAFANRSVSQCAIVTHEPTFLLRTLQSLPALLGV